MNGWITKVESYKVSIIVPVYNVEKYISDCLESLVNQSLQEIEIIIVNDGSPDNSLAIANEYYDKYKDKIRIFTTENKGVSHARNFGIDKAKGEYILFVDSDDTIQLDMCEKLYNKAINDQNDLVICGRNNIYENQKTGSVTLQESKTNVLSQNFALSNRSFEFAHISPFPWDKLFKREIIGDIRFPLNMRFEDIVFSYKVLFNSKSIGVVEEPLYNYRRTTEGGFLNSFSDEIYDIVKAFDMLFTYMKENSLMDMYLEEIEYICARHFLYRYPALFNENNTGKIDLKIGIINVTHEFLDNNVPHWKNSRYLRYSSSAMIKNNLDLYTNKEKLIKTVKDTEKKPQKIAKVNKQISVSTKKKQVKKKVPLSNRIKILKLFNLPERYKYTKMYETMPVDENIILLESKHGDDLAGNIFSILQEVTSPQYEDYNIYLVVKETNKESIQKLLENYDITGVNFVIIKSDEYVKLLATAKYLITDTSFPTYYIKKSNQVYLNTWHGTPLKKMGRTVLNREYGLGNIQRNFLISDYLLYQNEFSKEIFLEDYMIDKIYKGKVLLSGYPRNTAFFNTNRYQEIRQKCGIDDKQVIMYMPTWRGMLHKKDNKKQVKQIYDYFISIDNKLNDNQVFYVKLHTFVKQKIDYSHFIHIKPFPEEFETYDFLNATDMLVTDYSSIMFDYAVSKKKIVLFTYDKEEYLDGRGMYLDIDELGFPVVNTVDGLIEEINNKEFDYTDFFDKYCSLDNKNCTKLVCEAVILNDENKDLRVEKAQYSDNNILLFINKIPRGNRLPQLIDSLNLLDTTHLNYFVCFRAGKFKARSIELSNLKREINYFPIQNGLAATLSEKIATVLSTKLGLKFGFITSKIRSLTNREKLKNFGQTKFTFLFTIQTWMDWMKTRL